MLHKLPVPAGVRIIKAMEAKAWIELRGPGTEIRITAAGGVAVRARIPSSGGRKAANETA